MRESERRGAGLLARALLTAGCLLAGASARADDRSFIKIADQLTLIPNGNGAFTTLSQPQVSLGNIVFTGLGANSQRGIYRFDPNALTLSPVVDTSTPLPGTGIQPPGQSAQLPTTIDGIAMAVYGPDVGFRETFNGFDNRLVTTRGGLHVVADSSVAPGSFGPGTPVSMDETGLVFGNAFNKSGPFPGGIVQSYTRVTDAGAASNGSNFEDVPRYLARGGRVPQQTWGRIAGTRGPINLSTSAGFFSFSDGASIGPQPANFQIPGDTSAFTNYGGTFSDDGSAAVFTAIASPTGFGGRITLLTKSGAAGPLRVVADTNTVVPGLDGVTKFSSFPVLTIDGGTIAFLGTTPANLTGIFVESNSALFELVSEGDTIGGKTIADLSMSGDRPLSNNQLVFTATFSDGSSGLFLATVPEPGTAGLAVVAVVAGLARRRRRLRAE